MSSDAPVLRGVDLRDDLGFHTVTESSVVYPGMIWDVQRDTVDLGTGVVQREFIGHPGAVAIAALRERADYPGHHEILLIKQYRHPIGVTEWELPAGLLDVEGEEPVLAAARELAEEVDMRAGTWHTLVDFHPSPGSMSEAIRIFVARDLSDVPEGERHERTDEEAGIQAAWVDLEEAFSAVLAGRIRNATVMIGVLAAYGSRRAGWVTLRPADEPFTALPRLR